MTGTGIPKQFDRHAAGVDGREPREAVGFREVALGSYPGVEQVTEGFWVGTCQLTCSWACQKPCSLPFTFRLI